MPVKKFLILTMAVMVVMSCMCMTAFAAETNLPPGAVVVGNGDVISTNDLTSLDAPYVIPADGVESITITGLFGFSSVYGWDGTQWINLNVADPTNVTIVPADYPQYTYYTMLRGDTMASQTVTVSWEKISPFKAIASSFDVSLDWLLFTITSLCAVILSNWLLLLGVVIVIVMLLFNKSRGVIKGV